MDKRARRFACTVCIAALLALGAPAHGQVLQPADPPVDEGNREVRAATPIQAPLGDQVDTTPTRHNQQVIDTDLNAGAGFGAIPPLARPGRHTILLQVAEERRFYVHRSVFGPCGHPQSPTDPNLIGFAQYEFAGPNNACSVDLLQRTLRFDTSLFDQLNGERIERAMLTYDEVPFDGCRQYGLVIDPETHEEFPGAGEPRGLTCWADGEGDPEHKPNGCVDVRIPLGDWRNNPPPIWRGAVATAFDAGPRRRLSPNAWDVTIPFSEQVSGSPRLGFLLSGDPVTLYELTADDNTRCISSVTNVQLEVTYVVPAS